VHIEWVARETVELFGAKRCLYGSNFPIEKLWTDYASLIAAYRAAVSQFSEADQHAILGVTAARVYRVS
jgi:predicted TIM-barrel fold metal-dependent hydrolase